VTKLRADILAVKDKDEDLKKYNVRMEGMIDDSRCNPLHIACWVGSLRITKLIVEKRANIEYMTSVHYNSVKF